MGQTRKLVRRRKTYTRKDYNDGNGMLTKIWGPGLWHFLHVMSFNYPAHPTTKDKKSYKNFLCQLRHVLPCGKCRKNLKKNLKMLPPKPSVFKNRNSFSRYIYNLHELINKMLHKKSNLTYKQVRERYEHFRARCATMKINTKKKKSCGCKKRCRKRCKKGTRKKEDGCTEPLYGEKAKCIIKIVPEKKKGKTFQMDKRCKKRRSLNTKL